MTQDGAPRWPQCAGREFDFDAAEPGMGPGRRSDTGRTGRTAPPAGLVVEGSRARSADYAFTHHKIQEVVYGAIPRHRRCYLHGKVGLAMERWLGSRRKLRAGGAGQPLRAGPPTGRRSGGQGRRRTCFRPAGRPSGSRPTRRPSGTYRRGLEILRTRCPRRPSASQRQLDLQIALTVPTTVVYGYAAPEIGLAYEQTCALARRLEDRAALFTALVGLVAVPQRRGRCRRGGSESGRRSSLSPKPVRNPPCFYRHAGRWVALHSHAAASRKRGSSGNGGLASADSAAHDRLAYRFGHDPAVIFHGIPDPHAMVTWVC